jgi:hypothetical protein
MWTFGRGEEWPVVLGMREKDGPVPKGEGERARGCSERRGAAPEIEGWVH